MARVSVSMYASVRDAAGMSILELQVADVRGILFELGTRFGEHMRSLLEAGVRAGELVILVNGVNADPSTYDAPLSDGDEVSVFPPISGG